MPMGDDSVLQLAGHHGRPTDCVRWVSHTEFIIRENECTATASLEGQNERKFRQIDGKNLGQEEEHI